MTAVTRRVTAPIAAKNLDMEIKPMVSHANQVDQVSRVAMTDTSTGPISQILSNGALFTTEAGEVLVLENRGITGVGVKSGISKQSDDYTNATWVKSNVTPTASAKTTPIGTLAGTKIEATATGATTLRQTSIIATKTDQTFDTWIAKGSGATDCNSFAIRNDTTATNLLVISYNYDTKEITYITGSSGAVITDSIDDWDLMSLSVVSGVTIGDSLAVYAGFVGSAETAGEYAYFWRSLVTDTAKSMHPITIKTEADPVSTATRSGTASLSLDLETGAKKAREAFEGSTFGNPVLSSGNLDSGEMYEVITTEADHFGAGAVAGDRVSGLTTALDANNTVRLVGDAAFRLTGEFTPGVGAGDVANETIISILSINDDNSGLLYLYKNASGNATLRFSDETNTAAISFDWQGGTTYQFEIRIGHNVSAAARRAQVVSGATESALADVVDHLPISSAEKLVVGYGTSHMISVDNLKLRPISTVVGWRESA